MTMLVREVPLRDDGSFMFMLPLLHLLQRDRRCDPPLALEPRASVWGLESLLCGLLEVALTVERLSGGVALAVERLLEVVAKVERLPEVKLAGSLPLAESPAEG